jgi:hypothetical protein
MEHPRCPIEESMKVVAPSRKTELLSDVVLVVAVLYGGCRTAMILHGLATPLPKGEIRMDLFDEIQSMKGLLNGLLPLAGLALALSAGIKIRAKTLRPLALALGLAAIVGVFACTAATYSLLVAMHPGVNLWTLIWWRFGS